MKDQISNLNSLGISAFYIEVCLDQPLQDILVEKGIDAFHNLNQGLAKIVWDTRCESRHSSYLAQNPNGNPSRETSRPLVTSSLARPLRPLKPRRSIPSLSHSSLKLMRSTSDKSNQHSKTFNSTFWAQLVRFTFFSGIQRLAISFVLILKRKKGFKIIDRLHKKTIF